MNQYMQFVIYAIFTSITVQRDILLQCASESLSMFGENTKNALIAQFQKHGIEFTPDGFNVKQFCAVTSEMLGRSADFIFIKIVDDFCRKSNMSLEESGLYGKTRYINNSDVLVSLFLKVRDGTFDRRA